MYLLSHSRRAFSQWRQSAQSPWKTVRHSYFPSRLYSCTIFRRQTPRPKLPFLIDVDEEGSFSGAAGFFPTHHEAQEQRREGIDLVQSIDSLLEHRALVTSEHLAIGVKEIPRLFPHKADLSYSPPDSTHASTPTLTEQTLSSQPVIGRGFRTKPPLRWITAAYIDHVLSSDKQWWHFAAFTDDEVLLRIFDGPRVTHLADRGYAEEDVHTWAWIVTSTDVNLAIRRFIAITEERAIQGKTEMPRFLLLQLLRASDLNADSLSQLITTLLKAAERHPLMSDTTSQHAKFAQGQIQDLRNGLWNIDEATLLMVRLLRHARRVAPILFDDIARLACRILLSWHNQGHDAYQRLTYASNRLLTLFALPAGPHPFQSVPKQQRAQITLMRSMLSKKPQITLNREGYRALIKVQLAHEKTSEERAWVRAQGGSWPPWRKLNMGIQQDVEYTGKKSRAMKVLKRMLEAGYGHGTWEKIAGILAGWDTDRSPTIQTRSILKNARYAPLPDAVGVQDASLLAELWAARITATRSVREAWACFGSYSKTTPKMERRYEPYRAMFAKLIARQQDELVITNIVPGDGKETYPDPESPRDLVYVETALPSVDLFYQSMVNDGVKPVGRLLTELINNAVTVDQGCQYLEDSAYSEVKKDVLLHPEKYSVAQLVDTIAGVPHHFLAAFLAMLVRCDKTFDRKFTLPPREDQEGARQRSPRGYALFLLFTCNPKYLPAWNNVLEAFHDILAQQRWQRFKFKGVNVQAGRIIHNLVVSNLDTDFTTFRLTVAILQMGLRTSDDTVMDYPNLVLVDKAKALFTRAVYKKSAAWITAVDDARVIDWPIPEDMRAIIQVLGIAGDKEGLLDLVRWMHANRVDVVAVERNRQNAPAYRKMYMVILRIFLEGRWVADESQRDTYAITDQQLADVKQKLETTLEWPSDAEVREMLDGWPGWLAMVRNCDKARRKQEHKESGRSQNMAIKLDT